MNGLFLDLLLKLNLKKLHISQVAELVDDKKL
jgi:hypothetical protein